MSESLGEKVARLFSEHTLAWLFLIASIMIASGLFYVLAERPPLSLGIHMIYPGTGAQTISEFLLVFFLYILSVAGLLLVYEAPRYRARQSLATIYLVSGILASLLSTLLLLFIVYGSK